MVSSKKWHQCIGGKNVIFIYWMLILLEIFLAIRWGEFSKMAVVGQQVPPFPAPQGNHSNNIFYGRHDLE